MSQETGGPTSRGRTRSRPALGSLALPADPARTYLLFGGMVAVLAVAVSVLRGWEAGEPVVGSVLGLVLGGLVLGTFRRATPANAPEHDREGRSYSLPATPSRGQIVDWLRPIAPAAIWVLAVVVVDQSSVTPGLIGTVAIALTGNVALWKLATSIPRVEAWWKRAE